ACAARLHGHVAPQESEGDHACSTPHHGDDDEQQRHGSHDQRCVGEGSYGMVADPARRRNGTRGKQSRALRWSGLHAHRPTALDAEAASPTMARAIRLTRIVITNSTTPRPISAARKSPVASPN